MMRSRSRPLNIWLMEPRALRIRLAVLLAGGALCVHQLRYLLAYGSHSTEELALQGHFYLTLVSPAVIGLVMLAAIELIVRLARASRGPLRDSRLPATHRLWAAASAALLAIYSLQELTESELAPGHPAGVAGLFGHGGWIAVALAVLLGGVTALLVRGADAAVKLVSRRSRRRPVRSSSPLRSRAACHKRLALDAVARHLAGRGPPIVASADV